MTEYVSYIYQIIDKFSPALRRINTANHKFTEQMKKAKGGLKQFGDKTANLQNALAGIGAGAGLTLVAKKAMDFESVMTDVAKVVNFTSEEQFASFRENILRTSTELGKLPKNLAEIAVAGGKLGVAVKDMNAFIGVVARTSVAFDMLESTAGDQIGSIQAKMGLTVEATGDLMDAVNFLADNTAASGSRMVNIIARTAGTMKSIDMPRNFIAGWASFADQMEVTQELAASGLNMMIARMRQMPGMLEMMIKSPQAAISGLLKSLAGLDAVQRAKQVDKLFGPEAGRFVLKAVTNMEKFDDTMKLISGDTQYAGSMMRELTKKLATSETAWGKIKGIFDVVAITIGDVLTPYIKAVAPDIVNIGFAFRQWALAHPEIVKIGLAVAAITAVAAPLLVILGMVASGIAVISGPVGLVIIAIGAVGAAVYQAWKNWDYLVEDIQWGLGKIKELITSVFMHIPIVAMIQAIRGEWKYLIDDIKIYFDIIKKIATAPSIIGSKIAGFLGFGKDEKGVAAQNTIAGKSTLNGNIVVSAQAGTKVESAGLKTNTPGNLGINLAGASP